MPPHRQVGWVALNLLLHTLATSRGDTRPSWLQLSQVTTARRPSVFLPSSEMQLFPFDKSLRIAYERFSFAHIAAVFAMGTLATFGYGAFLIIGGVVTDPAAEFEKLEQGCYIKSFVSACIRIKVATTFTHSPFAKRRIAATRHANFLRTHANETAVRVAKHGQSPSTTSVRLWIVGGAWKAKAATRSSGCTSAETVNATKYLIPPTTRATFSSWASSSRVSARYFPSSAVVSRKKSFAANAMIATSPSPNHQAGHEARCCEGSASKRLPQCTGAPPLALPC